MILTEEQLLIQETRPQVRAGAAGPELGQVGAGGAFPRGIFTELGALGFMGMTVPAEWGGAGADNVAYSLALQEIAAGDGALATVVSGHNSVGVMPILNYGTEAQKERYVRDMATGAKLTAFASTEPQGGSDAASIRTRAVRKGDSYVLNGTKQFITSGATADIALVFAVTDPAPASAASLPSSSIPRRRATSSRASRRRWARTRPTPARSSSRTARSPPRTGSARRARATASRSPTWRAAASASPRSASAWRARRWRSPCAMRTSASAFGKPIFEHQAVSFRLADMATSLEAARQLTLHAAALKDAGRPCLTEASMAKLFASETAEKICSDAIQTLGGVGYIQDFGVERIYRGVRGAKIYEGTNDIQRLVISRSLTGA